MYRLFLSHKKSIGELAKSVPIWSKKSIGFYSIIVDGGTFCFFFFFFLGFDCEEKIYGKNLKKKKEKKKKKKKN